MMKGESYDYSGVSFHAMERLEQLAAMISNGEGTKTRTGVSNGFALLEAKELHERNGLFLRWCRLVLGFKPRTAQRYMNAARLFQSHGEDVYRLPLTAAEDLGASSVDPTIVHEVLARVRRGERVTVEWVTEAIGRGGGTTSTAKESISGHSEQMAEIIIEALDLQHCLLLRAFIEERPPARLFMGHLADRAAAKIGSSRTTWTTPLSLPAG
ncbi:hypothetical protein QWJ07_23525 [Frankia sp. RB7]|nr:hypothetical protein [Frankia sp. RB7]